MHLDAHFLEFEILDYDNVKPLKSKFSINLNHVCIFGIYNGWFSTIS
jgi:hypothetical protein